MWAIVGCHRIATDRRELRRPWRVYVRVHDFKFHFRGFAMRAAAPSTIRVHEPVALGDVSLAPRELTGVSQAELARSMTAYLTASAPDSDAQALGRPGDPSCARCVIPLSFGQNTKACRAIEP